VLLLFPLLLLLLLLLHPWCGSCGLHSICRQNSCSARLLELPLLLSLQQLLLLLWRMRLVGRRSVAGIMRRWLPQLLASSPARGAPRPPCSWGCAVDHAQGDRGSKLLRASGGARDALPLLGRGCSWRLCRRVRSTAGSRRHGGGRRTK
jgi:hypothetical protein